MERKRTLIWICQGASSSLYFSTLSAYRKHPAQRWSDQISQGFKEEKILEFDFLKEEYWYQDCIFPRYTIFSWIILLHPPPPWGSGGEFTLHPPHILLPTRKTRTTQLRAKTQREKFEIFQSNKSHKQLFGTQYSSALDNRAYCCNWFKRGEL